MTLLTCLLLGALAARQPIATDPYVTVSVPALPAPVPSDGTRLTVFEVVLTPHLAGPIEVAELSIYAAGSDTMLAHYDTAGLRTRLSSAAPEIVQGPQLSRRTSRIYVELDLGRIALPSALVAVVGYRMEDGSLREARSPEIFFDRRVTSALAPPLHGGPWVAVHAADWERGHRRMVYATRGVEHIPGRYAIDWVGVDRQGRLTVANPDRPRDAVGYGVPVLAVADAIVEDVRDGMPEADSIAGNETKAHQDASGNYVVLRLGKRRFAFYEHLRPGSITVRKGQRVKVGQTIGSLGFTGDSTGPHLHLHVADCASPLGCEGVPFTISEMTELGRHDDVALMGLRHWNDTDARGKIDPEWPGYNVVVTFDEGGAVAKRDDVAASGDRAKRPDHH